MEIDKVASWLVDFNSNSSSHISFLHKVSDFLTKTSSHDESNKKILSQRIYSKKIKISPDLPTYLLDCLKEDSVQIRRVAPILFLVTSDAKTRQNLARNGFVELFGNVWVDLLMNEGKGYVGEDFFDVLVRFIEDSEDNFLKLQNCGVILSLFLLLSKQTQPRVFILHSLYSFYALVFEHEKIEENRRKPAKIQRSSIFSFLSTTTAVEENPIEDYVYSSAILAIQSDLVSECSDESFALEFLRILFVFCQLQNSEGEFRILNKVQSLKILEEVSEIIAKYPENSDFYLYEQILREYARFIFVGIMPSINSPLSNGNLSISSVFTVKKAIRNIPALRGLIAVALHSVTIKIRRLTLQLLSDIFAQNTYNYRFFIDNSVFLELIDKSSDDLELIRCVTGILQEIIVRNVFIPVKELDFLATNLSRYQSDQILCILEFFTRVTDVLEADVLINRLFILIEKFGSENSKIVEKSFFIIAKLLKKSTSKTPEMLLDLEQHYCDTIFTYMTSPDLSIPTLAPDVFKCFKIFIFQTKQPEKFIPVLLKSLRSDTFLEFIKLISTIASRDARLWEEINKFHIFDLIKKSIQKFSISYSKPQLSQILLSTLSLPLPLPLFKEILYLSMDKIPKLEFSVEIAKILIQKSLGNSEILLENISCDTQIVHFCYFKEILYLIAYAKMRIADFQITAFSLILNVAFNRLIASSQCRNFHTARRAHYFRDLLELFFPVNQESLYPIAAHLPTTRLIQDFIAYSPDHTETLHILGFLRSTQTVLRNVRGREHASRFLLSSVVKSMRSRVVSRPETYMEFTGVAELEMDGFSIPSTGVSLSVWVYIDEYGSEDITVFEAFNRHRQSIFRVEILAERGIIALTTTSAIQNNPLLFRKFSLRTRQWYHVVLVQERRLLLSTIAGLYVNGIKIQQEKYAYPEEEVYSGSARFGGTRVESGKWRLGWSLVYSTAVSDTAVAALYAIGNLSFHKEFPNVLENASYYTKDLLLKEKTLVRSVADAVRKTYAAKNDPSEIPGQEIEFPAEFLLYSFHAEGISSDNTIVNMVRPRQMKTRILGNVLKNAPLGIGGSLLKIGGISTFLPFISLEETAENLLLYIEFFVLLSADATSPEHIAFLQKGRHYHTLAWLLRGKVRNFNLNQWKILCELLMNLCGISCQGKFGKISNEICFKSLIIDLNFIFFPLIHIKKSNSNYQQRLEMIEYALEMILNIIKTNPNRLENIKILHRHNGFSWILSLLIKISKFPPESTKHIAKFSGLILEIIESYASEPLEIADISALSDYAVEIIEIRKHKNRGMTTHTLLHRQLQGGVLVLLEKILSQSIPAHVPSRTFTFRSRKKGMERWMLIHEILNLTYILTILESCQHRYEPQIVCKALRLLAIKVQHGQGIGEIDFDQLIDFLKSLYGLLTPYATCFAVYEVLFVVLTQCSVELSPVLDTVNEVEMYNEKPHWKDISTRFYTENVSFENSDFFREIVLLIVFLLREAGMQRKDTLHHMYWVDKLKTQNLKRKRARSCEGVSGERKVKKDVRSEVSKIIHVSEEYVMRRDTAEEAVILMLRSLFEAHVAIRVLFMDEMICFALCELYFQKRKQRNSLGKQIVEREIFEFISKIAMRSVTAEPVNIFSQEESLWKVFFSGVECGKHIGDEFLVKLSCSLMKELSTRVSSGNRFSEAVMVEIGDFIEFVVILLISVVSEGFVSDFIAIFGFLVDIKKTIPCDARYWTLEDEVDIWKQGKRYKMDVLMTGSMNLSALVAIKVLNSTKRYILFLLNLVNAERVEEIVEKLPLNMYFHKSEIDVTFFMSFVWFLWKKCIKSLHLDTATVKPEIPRVLQSYRDVIARYMTTIEEIINFYTKESAESENAHNFHYFRVSMKILTDDLVAYMNMIEPLKEGLDWVMNTVFYTEYVSQIAQWNKSDVQNFTIENEKKSTKITTKSKKFHRQRNKTHKDNIKQVIEHHSVIRDRQIHRVMDAEKTVIELDYQLDLLWRRMSSVIYQTDYLLTGKIDPKAIVYLSSRWRLDFIQGSNRIRKKIQAASFIPSAISIPGSSTHRLMKDFSRSLAPFIKDDFHAGPLSPPRRAMPRLKLQVINEEDSLPGNNLDWIGGLSLDSLRGTRRVIEREKSRSATNSPINRGKTRGLQRTRSMTLREESLSSEDLLMAVPEVELNSKDNLAILVDPGDEAQSMYNCSRVVVLEEIEGILIFCNECLYVIDGYRIPKGTDDQLEIDEVEIVETSTRRTTPRKKSQLYKRRDTASTQSSPTRKTIVFVDEEDILTSRKRLAYSEIIEINKRRYLLQEAGLEVFCSNGSNLLLVFATKNRNEIYEKILGKWYIAARFSTYGTYVLVII